MREYKIDKIKIEEYAERNSNRLRKLLILSMIIPTIILILINIKKDTLDEIWLNLISLIISTFIFGFIYLNAKTLVRLCAKNLVITLDDNSIVRSIDLDNEPKMNFMHKFEFNTVRFLGKATPITLK
tara:strand:+ start:336 stop:716 length:381 start_codon:yes stop_codon:yes gene_type:complete